MVASTAQPVITSHWCLIRCGDGQMMATPGCRPSFGPCRARDAAICAEGWRLRSSMPEPLCP
eukprot:11222281-Lingulodinium_polyedra.AAC.1